jgi:hypothetical protein
MDGNDRMGVGVAATLDRAHAAAAAGGFGAQGAQAVHFWGMIAIAALVALHVRMNR